MCINRLGMILSSILIKQSKIITPRITQLLNYFMRFSIMSKKLPDLWILHLVISRKIPRTAHRQHPYQITLIIRIINVRTVNCFHVLFRKPPQILINTAVENESSVNDFPTAEYFSSDIHFAGV